MRFDIPKGATPIDDDEAADLIPSLSLQAELNDFEAANIARATAWCRRSREVRQDLLEVATWKSIHRRMFDRTWRWAGKPRQTEKSIGVSPYRITTELTMLRDDTKTWIENASYPLEEIAARFHHRLVWIHPFVNGNGRHARLMADLLCLKLGIAPFTWGSANLVSASEARRQYIGALQQADQHDFGPLLIFVRS